MTEIRALFYADRRAFVNDVRRALRSPGRILLWLTYAVIIGFFFVSRTHGVSYATSGVGPDVVRADYLLCAQGLALALALTFGSGRAGFFRTLAEARFIIGSTVRAPIALAYLQARDSLSSAFRWISSLFYLGFILAPHRLSALGAATDVAIVAALFAATKAVGLTRKLARPPWPLVSQAAGIPLALATAAVVVRDLAEQLPVPDAFAEPILRAIPAIHPGLILTAPNPAWLLAPIAIVAPAIAMLASAGRDAYPELYALSVMRLDGATSLIERRRRKERAGISSDAARIRVPAPPGSLVLVWKTIVEFRRTHANVVGSVAGAIAWVAIGFALARIGAALGPAFIAGVSPFFGISVIVLSFLATSTLASELQRPLFWLCGISLFERLAALAVAHNIRKMFTLVLIGLGVAVGGGNAIEITAVALVMPALVLLVGCAGFVVYALVPNAGTGGPIAMLRLAISFVLLVPVVVVGVATGFFGGLLANGSITVLALAECAALVGIAAWRIDGRIDLVRA